MYIEPPELWLDPRVLKAMKTEPDPDAAVELVRYRSDQRVGDLMLQASGGAEFFIQVCEVSNSAGKFCGLTNYGRIFHYSFATKTWSTEIEPPDFGGTPEP